MKGNLLGQDSDSPHFFLRFITASLSYNMLFTSLLLVLFPFVVPVLEKMKVTLLPSKVMDFFNANFMKMKKERDNGYHVVSPAQRAFSVHSTVLLSAGGPWSSLQHLWGIHLLLSRITPCLSNVAGPETPPAWASMWKMYVFIGGLQSEPQHVLKLGGCKWSRHLLKELVLNKFCSLPTHLCSDCLLLSPGPG